MPPGSTTAPARRSLERGAVTSAPTAANAAHGVHEHGDASAARRRRRRAPPVLASRSASVAARRRRSSSRRRPSPRPSVPRSPARRSSHAVRDSTSANSSPSASASAATAASVGGGDAARTPRRGWPATPRSGSRSSRRRRSISSSWPTCTRSSATTCGRGRRALRTARLTGGERLELPRGRLSVTGSSPSASRNWPAPSFWISTVEQCCGRRRRRRCAVVGVDAEPE